MHWTVQTAPGLWVRIRITAPGATLAAKLQDNSGKTVQDISSLGGTGGPVVLSWIAHAPTYEIDLKLAGTYATQARFDLRVEDARPMRPGEDPQQYPPLAAAELIRNGQKLILAGQYQQALPMLAEARSAAAKLHDPRLEAQALYRAGMAHFYLQQRTQALALLHQALAIETSHGQTYEVGLTLNNIAMLEFLTGACTESQKDFRDALQIRQSHDDRRGVGYTLLGLADALYCTGQAQDSLDADLQALSVWRGLGDELSQAQTENTLGLVYLDLGDWQKAATTLESAISLWRKNKNRQGEGNSTYNLALVETRRGNSRKAKELDAGALALFEGIRDQRGAAYVLEAQAEAAGREGRHADALRLLQRSQNSLEKLNEAYEQGYVWQAKGTELRSLGRLAESKQAYAKALAIETQVGDSRGQAVSLFRRAQLESSMNQRDAALDDASAAIRLVEESRKQVLDSAHRASYLATKREIYVLKASLLMQAGKTAEAFQVSEAAHARALLDEVSGDATAPGAAKTASAAELQSALDPDTLFLEYLTGSEGSFGWAVTSDRIAAFALPARPRVQAVARDLFAAVTARRAHPRGETLETRAARLQQAHVGASRAAAELARWLLGPIPNQMRRERVVLAPDGPLSMIPFAMLLSRYGARLTEIPSASILLARMQQSDEGGFAPALVIADPAPRDRDLPRLEYSAPEAIALVAYFGNRGVRLQEGRRADTSALSQAQAGSAQLIHIAAHARADFRQPANSSVVLSDGNVTAAAIMRLKLRARLVTLSACETGAGAQVDGEGILSLSRAFLYAGARTVLSTLWPVDDQATAAFMQRFYAALLKRHEPPAQALRHAQQELQRNARWSDPYFWAGFTLQGE